MNIEITVRRTGRHVEVLQNGLTTGPLCLGELVEQVLALVYPNEVPRQPYAMRTQEQWDTEENPDQAQEAAE